MLNKRIFKLKFENSLIFARATHPHRHGYWKYASF